MHIVDSQIPGAVKAFHGTAGCVVCAGCAGCAIVVTIGWIKKRKIVVMIAYHCGHLILL
jgi:ribosomal protein L21E